MELLRKHRLKILKNVRKSGLIAIKIRSNDALNWVRECSDNDEVVIATINGKCIRFNEKDVRPMGRPSMGVRGIKLKEKDKVVEMDTVQNPSDTELLVIMENGLGKMTILNNYRLQSRGGTGVKTANITEKTG